MKIRRLPIFPLPGVVLLPGTLLPLHIFETRYRAMVADALEAGRTIGMALLKPGWQQEPEPLPIYPLGGAGEIVESQELPDGRYNIVLEGSFRYRVLEEAEPSPYRTARVEEVPTTRFGSVREAARVSRLAARLFESVSRSIELPGLPEEALGPERLASELALRLRYSPEELQELLETDSIEARFDTLVGRMAEWEKRIRFLAPFRPADADGTRN